MSGVKTSFFSKYFTSKSVKLLNFFETTLPFIQRCALDLPFLCKEPIPLLYVPHFLIYYSYLIYRYSQIDMSITLTQKQIASILSHAFFCTIPEPVECIALFFSFFFLFTFFFFFFFFLFLFLFLFPFFFFFFFFFRFNLILLDKFDTQETNFDVLYRAATAFPKARSKLECILHYFERLSLKGTTKENWG